MEEGLEVLSKIAFSHPHSAYTAYAKGYKSKFTFYQRTIDSFEDYLEAIDGILRDNLLPALFGLEEDLPEFVKEVSTLAQGGLGIQSLQDEAPKQISGFQSNICFTYALNQVTKFCFARFCRRGKKAATIIIISKDEGQN